MGHGGKMPNSELTSELLYNTLLLRAGYRMRSGDRVVSSRHTCLSTFRHNLRA